MQRTALKKTEDQKKSGLSEPREKLLGRVGSHQDYSKAHDTGCVFLKWARAPSRERHKKQQRKGLVKKSKVRAHKKKRAVRKYTDATEKKPAKQPARY